jgi:hypothetical protein
MPTSGSGTATPVQQQNSSKDQVSQAQQVQVAPPVQVVQPNNMAAAMAQRLTNGHGPHHNNHHRGGTPMGGQVSSQPSSRLTSPAVSSSSRLSPGLSTPTGLGGGPNNVPTARVMPISSSSMPSRYYFMGPLWLARPPRPGPCLDFGFQYALIRNRSKKMGVEYWALPRSNSPWRPCFRITFLQPYHLYQWIVNIKGFTTFILLQFKLYF